MYKMILPFLFLSSLLAPVLPAQIGKSRVDVKARFVPSKASPGDKVTLIIEGKVHADYHLYGKKQGGEPSLEIPKADPKAKGPVLRPVGGFQVADGELHLDRDDPTTEYFWIQGDTVFRQEFEIPKGTPSGQVKFVGRLHYEACTETICDPAFEQPILATLQVQAKPPRRTTPPSSKHLGNHQEMEVVVTPARARAGETVQIEIRTRMEPGWHNYGSTPGEASIPVTMSFEDYQGNLLKPVGEAMIPPGEPHEVDEIVTYELTDEWVMSQILKVPEGTKPGEFIFAFHVGYMACDEGMCDPLVETVLGGKVVVEAGAARVVESAKGAVSQEPKGSGGGNIANEEVKKISVLNYFLLAIGAGLFALIMPCTYPMIPITISFFTKQAEMRGGSVLPLALLYGAGIVGSFLLVGALVTVLGFDMQAFALSGTVNIILASLFVFFAMSLFGLVELKPPAFMMNTATKASGVGGPMGVFLMGGTLCISSFACTAPFLGTMLAAGSSSGSKTLLMAGMAVFGLTMALPFVILSMVPGKLPRSGGWMTTAKVIFGFVELAAALKFLSIVDVSWELKMLPRELFLTIWAGLFAVCGVYTLGLIKFKGDTGEIGGGRLLTGTAIAVFACYCMYGASGYRLDNEVMVAFEPPYSSQTVGSRMSGNAESVVPHEIVKDDFDAAVQIAMRDQKLLLVNFTGYN